MAAAELRRRPRVKVIHNSKVRLGSDDQQPRIRRDEMVFQPCGGGRRILRKSLYGNY